MAKRETTRFTITMDKDLATQLELIAKTLNESGNANGHFTKSRLISISVATFINNACSDDGIKIKAN